MATLPKDGTVQLIATADEPTSQFAGWTGGGCEGTDPCELVLLDDVTVDAAFDIALRRLSVVPSGSGMGSVTSVPEGIDCGGDCEEQVPYGTSVELAATAETGSTFMGWAGACSGSGACTVTVDADVEVTAAFALDDSLVVTKTGTGMGEVTSNPAGIDCGPECEHVFPHASAVTLSAAPIGDATFAGWSGDCTGTGACTVTMDAAKAVTATFTQNQYTLTVLRGGTGMGSVDSDVAGITCGADCNETYDSGTTITLTATPNPDSTFTGWSGGGCSGTTTCAVTLAAATTVTATFARNQYDLTVVRAGAGTGTVTSTPAGINCGADCSERYTTGTVVQLTAVATGGSDFVGWSGACSGTTTCSVTMSAAKNVTATFRRPGVYYTILDEISSSDTLQSIAPASGTATAIGSTSFAYETMADCAWNPTNNLLYVLTRGSLYRVNVATNTAVLVGSAGVTNTPSLVFYKGALYGVQYGQLVRFNITTGATTQIGPTGLGSTEEVVGLAWDTLRDRVIGYGLSGSFYAINMTTGAATIVGPPAGSAEGGMTYDPFIDRFVVAKGDGRLDLYDPVSYSASSLSMNLGKHSCIAYRP